MRSRDFARMHTVLMRVMLQHATRVSSLPFVSREAHSTIDGPLHFDISGVRYIWFEHLLHLARNNFFQVKNLSLTLESTSPVIHSLDSVVFSVLSKFLWREGWHKNRDVYLCDAHLLKIWIYELTHFHTKFVMDQNILNSYLFLTSVEFVCIHMVSFENQAVDVNWSQLFQKEKLVCYH